MNLIASSLQDNVIIMLFTRYINAILAPVVISYQA